MYSLHTFGVVDDGIWEYWAFNACYCSAIWQRHKISPDLSLIVFDPERERPDSQIATRSGVVSMVNRVDRPPLFRFFRLFNRNGLIVETTSGRVTLIESCRRLRSTCIPNFNFQLTSFSFYILNKSKKKKQQQHIDVYNNKSMNE